MSVTRFSVIDDERKIILGVDKESIFEPGVVYEAKKVLNQIIIKALGKYSLPKDAKSQNTVATEGSEINVILYSGFHLLTESDFAHLNIKNNKNFKITSGKEAEKLEALNYGSIVTWSDNVQIYMRHKDFYKEAMLIDDEEGFKKYGSSAYWIPNHILNEIEKVEEILKKESHEVDNKLESIKEKVEEILKESHDVLENFSGWKEPFQEEFAEIYLEFTRLKLKLKKF